MNCGKETVHYQYFSCLVLPDRRATLVSKVSVRRTVHTEQSSWIVVINRSRASLDLRNVFLAMLN
jgi:hypothetical protein